MPDRVNDNGDRVKKLPTMAERAETIKAYMQKHPDATRSAIRVALKYGSGTMRRVEAMGLVKFPAPPARINVKTFWTPARDRVLSRLYADHTAAEIRAITEWDINDSQIRARASFLGLTKGGKKNQRLTVEQHNGYRVITHLGMAE